MKSLGAGQLVSDRENCIKFAQSCGVLDAMTIGIESVAQIDDNLNLLNKYPVA